MKNVVQKNGEKKKRNVSTRIETIAGSEVTIFTPTRKTPTAKAIFIHGGAWCFSDVKSFSPFIATFSKYLDCEIYAIDYPKAPKYPFPRGLDHCQEVSAEILGSFGKVYRL